MNFLLKAILIASAVAPLNVLSMQEESIETLSKQNSHIEKLTDAKMWQIKLCGACNEGNFEQVVYVLEEAKKSGFFDKGFLTHPLINAFESRNFNEDIIFLLVHNGASVQGAFFNFVRQNQADVLARLFDMCGSLIDVNEESEASATWFLSRQTALHEAVWRNNLDLVRFLISKGANCNLKEKTKGTLLHVICGFSFDYDDELGKQLEIVKLLLDNGASRDVRDKHGNKPLDLAVKNNNSEVSKLFIERR